jgi:hypothetical protein
MPASELIASAARTATNYSATQDNRSSTGLILAVNITVAGTGGITPEIELYDPASSAWRSLAVFSQLTGTGPALLLLSQAVAATIGGDLAEHEIAPLPQVEWRLKLTHADGSSWTYSVGLALLE